MSAEDKEILADFITEANEGLEKAEGLLLQLEDLLSENRQADSSLIDSLFRVFHSIKGSAGFLGLTLVNTLTHQAESVLDRIRKGKLALDKEKIDLFFEVSDALQIILNYLQEHEEEHGFQNDFTELINRLKKMAESDNRSPSETPREDSTESEQDSDTQAQQPPREMLITDQMKKDFAEESRELLDLLEQDLMALEKTPADVDRLNSVFRGLHTIKGNAGFLGFADINQICHKAESIFDLARSGKIELQERQISLMLQIIDFIGAALEALEQGKPAVIAGKNALLDLMDDMMDLPEKKRDESGANETPKKNDQKQKSAGEKVLPQAGTARFSHQKLSDVIRVDVSKLNKLMDLVGEIVIAESSLLNHYSFQQDEADGFLKSLVYLQKNIRELQDLATSMRMVPLSGLFGKMQRLVRDISAKKEKEAELIIRGGETEVDRSVIEHISDPLIHILRNALDHGIEAPEARKQKGKPSKGRIEIDVQRVGGQIWIKVKDDGQGLNKEKILKRAWERGLIPNGQVPESDQSIYNLIFEPGFSTADKITNISGRGVGMDVVQKNIEKIRGTISLYTVPNKGTTIVMKIPLTTAIIDGMLVRAGRSLYAIPMLDIREAIQTGEQFLLELIDGQEVIKVRDRLIPVIRLHRIHARLNTGTETNEGIVIISEIAGKAIGFLVDEILGEQQLVLKPLPKYLGRLEGVSGCAVLGNGDIALILDLGALLNYLEARSSHSEWKMANVEA